MPSAVVIGKAIQPKGSWVLKGFRFSEWKVEGEKREPMKLEPEDEEIAMAAVVLGVLRCLALGGR